MRIANIATYPAREQTCLPSLKSIASQVDVLNVVLNEYRSVPSAFKAIRNANYIFPSSNLKDVGKFYVEMAAEDDVFLCDDDIIYPDDYTDWMIRFRAECGVKSPVLGLHGVIYSDYYDGRSRSGRLVYNFVRELEEQTRVNQLGTGTVHVKGYQMPNLAYMQGSSGYVDIRFARHAYDKGYPMICVARQASWLRELENDTTIFMTVTNNLPVEALREVRSFGGLSRLIR